MKFSDAALRSLPLSANGQKLYTDDSLLGFGLRVSAKSKTFVLTLGADRTRITLGRFPLLTLAEARKKAFGILRDRELGVVDKPSPTFAVVLAEYQAHRDERLRRATRQADGYFFKPFEPLSSQKVADIETASIEDILKEMDAPTTRRHAFIRMQGLFRYATKRGYLDRSPMEALDCPPDQEARERVLEDAELRRVIETARVYGHPYGTIVELCAILGQRRQQIGSLRVEYVDFDNQLITWPSECMKTGRKHTIPFGPMTKSILERMSKRTESLYFASQVNGPFVGWSYHKTKFDAECGVPDFHLHDLRRTLATRWQEMGIEIATTEKMLSHSAITGGLVGVYQRSAYIEQMRLAVQRWETWLQTLLSNTENHDGRELPGIHQERTQATE